MTREAKIGMLTGLGVIVLIGVLLSEYLGDKNTGPNVATGQMAPLPVGAAFRDQVTSPVGVPAMAPAGQTTQLAGGGEISTPIATNNATLPPAMAGVDAPDGTGSVAIGPVAPIEVGPMVADSRVDGPPMFSAKEPMVPAKLTEAPSPGRSLTVAARNDVQTTTYTVAAGDTLAKIAKKFYNSAKNSDVQKIVAANPGVLKDATTMLVVNKKLVIPGVVATAPVAPVAVTVPVATRGQAKAAAAQDPVMVYMPSSSMKDAVPPTVVLPPKKAEVAVVVKDVPVAKKATTYTVQSGDTLEKIAKKLTPAKTTETVQKLVSLNGIKDPKGLQVGQVLKVPA